MSTVLLRDIGNLQNKSHTKISELTGSVEAIHDIMLTVNVRIQRGGRGSMGPEISCTK